MVLVRETHGVSPSPSYFLRGTPPHSREWSLELSVVTMNLLLHVSSMRNVCGKYTHASSRTSGVQGELSDLPQIGQISKDTGLPEYVS